MMEVNASKEVGICISVSAKLGTEITMEWFSIKGNKAQAITCIISTSK